MPTDNVVDLSTFGSLSPDSAPLPLPTWQRLTKSNPLIGLQRFCRCVYACGCWVQWRAGSVDAPLPHGADVDPWDYAAAWLGNWHQERACKDHGGPEWRWNEEEKDHARSEGVGNGAMGGTAR